MHSLILRTAAVSALSISWLLVAPAAALPLGTAFTYQGRLKSGGSPANDSYDLQFTLYDVETVGSIVAGPVCADNVNVADGLFTVPLDFGAAAFNGDARWLDIGVRADATAGNCGAGAYTPLVPRQKLTGVPYALFSTAPWATSGANISNTNTGNVGIGTSAPMSPLHVTTAGTPAVFAETTGGAGTNFGVIGSSASTSGRGVLGTVGAASGATYGVVGESQSAIGTGVRGWAKDTTGQNYGVYGQTSSVNGTGVYGLALANTGTNYGVYGQTASTNGRGVYGFATAASGTTYGVHGQNNSTDGRGVFGEATAASGTNYGVYGRSDSPQGYGVYGESADNAGVYGIATATSGTNYGGFFWSDSTSGRGVNGTANAATGSTVGGIFQSSSTSGIGVNGIASALSGTTYGGRFLSASTSGTAVLGYATGLSGANYGVYGQTNSPDGYSGYFLNGLIYLGGDVGIGVSNPLFRLHLSQNSAAKPTSNTWTISSDRRLKKNITPIDGALDQLLQLHGVTYQWIHPEDQGDMAGTYTGMIAQDVEKVFPEWISEDKDGYKHLTVIGFEGLAVEALRQLRTEKDSQIRSQQREIEVQRAAIDLLREQVQRLQATVQALAEDIHNQGNR